MELLMAYYQHELLCLGALAAEAPGRQRAVAAEGEEVGEVDSIRLAAALPGSANTPVALAG